MTPSLPAEPLFHTYDTRTFHTFRQARIVAKAPFSLDRLAVTGHGGTAVIEWYCGSMSALATPATEVVGLQLDGTEIAETTVSGRGGEYDARAGILRWVGQLSPGPHTVSVSLQSSTGSAAIPLVVGGAPVVEGVDVAEHVRGYR